MKNRGSTPILTHLVGVHLRNIQTKFEANPCSSSREEVNNEILHSDIFVCLFNPLLCFFGSEGHVVLDRNPGPGYDTLLLRMIPGDLLSAFPHRQFQHTTWPFRQLGCTAKLLP